MKQYFSCIEKLHVILKQILLFIIMKYAVYVVDERQKVDTSTNHFDIFLAFLCKSNPNYPDCVQHKKFYIMLLLLSYTSKGNLLQICVN